MEEDFAIKQLVSTFAAVSGRMERPWGMQKVRMEPLNAKGIDTDGVASGLNFKREVSAVSGASDLRTVSGALHQQPNPVICRMLAPPSPVPIASSSSNGLGRAQRSRAPCTSRSQRNANRGFVKPIAVGIDFYSLRTATHGRAKPVFLEVFPTSVGLGSC